MDKKFYLSFDKEKICYFEKKLYNSDRCIIIVHGLGEHKGRYKYFINNMYQKGFSVLAMDLRGHGESGGKKGYVHDFFDYVKDLDFFIKYIQQEYPNNIICLFGHSLGGLISLQYYIRESSVDYLVLSNPLLLKIKNRIWKKILPYKFLGCIKIKKRISESSEMMKYSFNDPFATNYYYLRLLGEIFLNGIPSTIDKIELINRPLLLLRGVNDPVVKEKMFFSKIYKNKMIYVKKYKNLKHRLLQSEKKDNVIEDIYRWIEENIKRKEKNE